MNLLAHNGTTDGELEHQWNEVEEVQEMSLSFSCRSHLSSRLGDLSCMEVHNRHVFDRVARAVSCVMYILLLKESFMSNVNNGTTVLSTHE